MELIAEGKYGKVLFTPEVVKALTKAFKGDKTSLKGLLKRCEQFAEVGQHYFSEEQFKNEGKYSTGTKDGRKITVWALRYNQVRLYGCLNKQGNLFIVCSSDKKQQNKANANKLRKAAIIYAKHEKEKGNE